MGSIQISHSSLLPVTDLNDYDMVNELQNEKHLWQLSVPLKDMQSSPIWSICCHNFLGKLLHFQRMLKSLVSDEFQESDRDEGEEHKVYKIISHPNYRKGLIVTTLRTGPVPHFF